MQRFRVSHTTEYAYASPVPICHNLVHLRPRSLAHQICKSFRLEIDPIPTHVQDGLDYFGNHTSFFSIVRSQHGLRITGISEIEKSTPDEIPLSKTPAWEMVREGFHATRTSDSLAAYQFAFPTPRVPILAELAEYSRKSFTPGRPIGEAAVDLTKRIFEDLEYDPKATTVSTPIEEVFRERHGVCQDFAHLQIGCLRSIGLAARYVSGYLRTTPPPGKPRLVGADASHAWLAVYTGDGGWLDLDPTNNLVPTNDHITIGWGRDYDDVCPIRGVIVGGGSHRMKVSVDVEPLSRKSLATTSRPSLN